ncbi:MAG: hypothetical protein AAGJ31_05090 [Verrucomicrobiota bacterium]
MANGNPELINALRVTAERLAEGARYEWGHMGRCNCGHLVQTVTDLSDVEIATSIDYELDEWTEHARDYCEGTGGKVDDFFEALREVGFAHEDVIHLENLSDRRVLDRLGKGTHLRRNHRPDVVLYLDSLADLLEEAQTSVN